jgi:hypothetical protein
MVNGIFFYPEVYLPSSQYRSSNAILKKNKELKNNTNLTIVPNPSYNTIDIILPVGLNLKGVKIKIFNTLGQIQNDITINNSAREQLDISKYEAGV